MAKLKRCFCWLPVVIFAGCASGYHCYPCGQVSCHYCPPNPLAYSCFESDNCQDSIGQRYLAHEPLGKVSANSQ